MSMIKYRVHEVAKDFNVTSKVISQILTDYIAPPKNHMQVLENHELDVIFEYMTQHNQAASLEDIFKVPEKPAATAKKEAAPEKTAAAPEKKPAQQSTSFFYRIIRDTHPRKSPLSRARRPRSRSSRLRSSPKRPRSPISRTLRVRSRRSALSTPAAARL